MSKTLAVSQRRNKQSELKKKENKMTRIENDKWKKMN